MRENILHLKSARDKIRFIADDIQGSWQGRAESFIIPPGAPGRNVELFKRYTGVKKGLGSVEGQARLLHELANIELQAMELAYRSFVEYPDAPKEFREQMADLALSEAQHFEMCLDFLEDMGFQWGHWPVHLHLWSSVSAEDSLLDRLLIVHRYLEASGLDAGQAMLRRLAGCDAPHLAKAVTRITIEEVDHVAFGSRWYQQFCREQKLEPDVDFRERLGRLAVKLPKRVEAVDRDLRIRAGFTEAEIQAAVDLRTKYVTEFGRG